jgi:superfamily II DNA or RNA helicase
VTELRPYQIKAVEDIEQTNGNVLFVLPTGAGKTIVAAKIIEGTAAKSQRVLVLTHRREILHSLLDRQGAQKKIRNPYPQRTRACIPREHTLYPQRAQA